MNVCCCCQNVNEFWKIPKNGHSSVCSWFLFLFLFFWLISDSFHFWFLCVSFILSYGIIDHQYYYYYYWWLWIFFSKFIISILDLIKLNSLLFSLFLFFHFVHSFMMKLVNEMAKNTTTDDLLWYINLNLDIFFFFDLIWNCKTIFLSSQSYHLNFIFWSSFFFFYFEMENKFSTHTNEWTNTMVKYRIYILDVVFFSHWLEIHCWQWHI